jgi:hypothetical protein
MITLFTEFEGLAPEQVISIVKRCQWGSRDISLQEK